MKAVILAGGKGTRLAPYTTVLPKPLMPIGDVPILDVVIKQLHKHKFDEIIIAVGYLAELIMAYLNNGKKYGIKIGYSKEEKPLGTAGPLAQISGLDDAFIVMNGDILTTLNYSKLMDFHKEHNGIATIAMHERQLKIDFGTITTDETYRLSGYEEKPTLTYLVSMGIYIFEPEVLNYIKPNERLDFPDLVKILLKNGEKVQGYLSEDYWLDIGRHDDYQRAIKDFEEMKDIFLA